MNITILKSSKDEIEIEVDNLTIVEILRVYLNTDSNVEFAAWKGSQPGNPTVLRIETKGKTPKKALEDAVAKITKEADVLVSVVKKA